MLTMIELTWAAMGTYVDSHRQLINKLINSNRQQAIGTYAASNEQEIPE